MVLNVPESDQVHRYKGKCFDRVGESDNDITHSHYEVNNVYLRKQKQSSENEIAPPQITMDDLDEDAFRIMRSRIAIQTSDHPWLGMTNEEILKKEFWGKDFHTNKEGYKMAAILLFGKENTVLNFFLGIALMQYISALLMSDI